MIKNINELRKRIATLKSMNKYSWWAKFKMYYSILKHMASLVSIIKMIIFLIQIFS